MMIMMQMTQPKWPLASRCEEHRGHGPFQTTQIGARTRLQPRRPILELFCDWFAADQFIRGFPIWPQQRAGECIGSIKPVPWGSDRQCTRLTGGVSRPDYWPALSVGRTGEGVFSSFQWFCLICVVFIRFPMILVVSRWVSHVSGRPGERANGRTGETTPPEHKPD
jgi:hypothetical protein